MRFKNKMFVEDFNEKLETLVRDVETFREGCIILTTNESFKKFLKIALNIGNTLNSVRRFSNCLKLPLIHIPGYS